MNRKIFYGWYVALACGIGLACGLATVLTYTFGVFVTPLRQEFGWSQTEAFTALFLSVLTILTWLLKHEYWRDVH